MAQPVREFDIRPLLSAGEEPFHAIMKVLDSLAPEEQLRLLAPFRPEPLFLVLEKRGFAVQDRPLDKGGWEVLATPLNAPAPEAGLTPGSSPFANLWPRPLAELELGGQAMPEIRLQVFETLDELIAGDTLFALLDHEPRALFDELVRHGHEWAGNFDASGEIYRLMVRKGHEGGDGSHLP